MASMKSKEVRNDPLSRESRLNDRVLLTQEPYVIDHGNHRS